MPSIRPWLAAAALVVSVIVPLSGARAADPVLSVGDLAPDFRLAGSDGKTYTLAEFRGVRPVVIAWFPKAMAKT